MNLIYHSFGNSIVVHLAGKTHTLSKDDKRFKLVSKLIKENALEEIGLVLDAQHYKTINQVRDRILKSIGLEPLELMVS
jgi:hypothetical protein